MAGPDVPLAHPGALRRGAEHPLVHLLEHASFFTAGVALWWPLIQPVPMRRRLTGLQPVAYIGAAKFGLAALGIFLTWSTTAIYPYYEGMPRIWGLSPIEDQNVAGVIMMVEQSLTLAIVLVALFVRMLRRARPSSCAASGSRSARRRRRRGVERGGSALRARSPSGPTAAPPAAPALHRHVAAESHVAADPEPCGTRAATAAGGEALLEVGQQLEVVGVQLDHRDRVALRGFTRPVVRELVRVRAHHQQLIRLLHRREAGAGHPHAAAPSNSPIAAPIALSSWNTSGDDASVGSTVLRFTIIGSPSTPSRSSSARWSAFRSTYMLFVLK